MKILRSLTLIIAVFLLAAVPVFAKNPNKTTSVVLSSGETVDHDYFAAGDVVTLSGTVNGDAYVAGGTVTVNGTVTGDLFVAGGTVVINGTLGQDLRAVGGNVTVTSAVPGSVTVGGGNVTFTNAATIGGSVLAGAGTLDIAGTVGRGIMAGAGNVTLGNNVEGDVKIGAGVLSLMEGVQVDGNLTYWSDEEFVAGEGATVSGIVQRFDPPKSDVPAEWKGAQQDLGNRIARVFGGVFVAFKIASFIMTLVAGLILFSLMPNFTKNVVDTFSKKTLPSLGTGFITVVILPVAGFLLLVTLVGIPIGALLFSLMGAIVLVGHMYAGLSIGSVTLKWLNVETNRGLAYVVGLAMLFVISLIPFLGFVVKSVIELVAVGAIMTNKIAVARAMREKKLI